MRRTRPRALRSLATAALLLAALVAIPPLAAEQAITVVSFGGSYARACQQAYHEPFTAETGIEVRLEDYNGGLAQIRAQVETGNVHWDVVDLNVADAVLGCDEGLLEFIDPGDLPPGADGSSVEDDFVTGTLTDCGMGTIFFSSIYAYHPRHFAGDKPATIDDFFDLARFPGRRGMRRVPSDNLEIALLADGVPIDEVYATLETPEGVARAFRKLDTIKDHIVWWEAGAQPPQMLADGEVVMSTAYNGRIFNAQVRENQPFEIVWDGQILDNSQLVIVAGAPNLEAAREFITFAGRPESMAAVSKYISYGPVRRSGTPLVGTHVETGVEMAPHMPTTPANLTRALHHDWRWWSDRGDEMTERFAAWLAR
ncbi:MAG: ABC transporter substrate-binding protein [Spirochaetaceae bacterium]|nr:ABC transporter substrate-binding protein [Spirochaetaceae bacterium]